MADLNYMHAFNHTNPLKAEWFLQRKQTRKSEIQLMILYVIAGLKMEGPFGKDLRVASRNLKATLG